MTMPSDLVLLKENDTEGKPHMVTVSQLFVCWLGGGKEIP